MFTGGIIFLLTNNSYNRLTHTIDSLDKKKEEADVFNRVLRHNIRNGANSIILYSEIVKEETENKEKHLDKIIDNAKELVDLSNSVRDIQKIKNTQSFEQVNLEDLLGNAIKKAKKEHPKVDFSIENKRDIEVFGDEKLEFVFSELINNGIIHNDLSMNEREIEIDIKENEGTVSVFVCDNGPGIPEEELGPVLEGRETPLFHTSGFNLWVVKWIMENVDGEIKFKENKPRGTTIEIILKKIEIENKET